MYHHQTDSGLIKIFQTSYLIFVKTLLAIYIM